jgi:hypothetical protein
MGINASVADPMPQVTPSIQPEITPPTITVAAPTNNSAIYADTVNVRLTVYAPTSKDASASVISKIYCLPSWAADHAIPNHYVYLSTGEEHLQFKEINLTLTDVPVGQHSIEIGASGSVTVPEGTHSFQHDSATTTTVYLTITDHTTTPNGDSQNTPQPTIQTALIQITIIAISTVSAAALSFVLLKYKRHQKQ